MAVCRTGWKKRRVACEVLSPYLSVCLSVSSPMVPGGCFYLIGGKRERCERSNKETYLGFTKETKREGWRKGGRMCEFASGRKEENVGGGGWVHSCAHMGTSGET